VNLQQSYDELNLKKILRSLENRAPVFFPGSVGGECHRGLLLALQQLCDIQYGARDKFLSGVIAGWTASEPVAIAASGASESRVKAMRIARECGALLRALVSGDAINKSLSGVKDKTTTDNTCLLYMSPIRYTRTIGLLSVYTCKQYL